MVKISTRKNKNRGNIYDFSGSNYLWLSSVIKIGKFSAEIHFSWLPCFHGKNGSHVLVGMQINLLIWDDGFLSLLCFCLSHKIPQKPFNLWLQCDLEKLKGYHYSLQAFTWEISQSIFLFIFPVTGSPGGREGKGEEGWGEGKREEERGGAKLPAVGEPGQSDAGAAQGPDDAGVLPLPAFQTGNHSLHVHV